MLVHSLSTTAHCAYEIHGADTARYELYAVTKGRYEVRLALIPTCPDDDGLLVIQRTFMAGNIPSLAAGVMQIASLVAGDESDLAAYWAELDASARMDAAAEARHEAQQIPDDPE